jgi:hypothetical protein
MPAIPVEIVNTDWLQVGSSIILALAALAAFFLSYRTFKQNNNHIRKQQFESTFFSMMNQLEDITNNLTLKIVLGHTNGNKYPDYMTLTGKDVFEAFFIRKEFYVDNKDFLKEIKEKNIEVFDSRIEQSLRDTMNFELTFATHSVNEKCIRSIGLMYLIMALGIKSYKVVNGIRMFDHYFRYIYRILKFVDEADYLEKNRKHIDERYKYTSILRATFSPYELVFLFYNGLLYKKSKYYLEKYTMLKNLRQELTSVSHRDYELNFIDNKERDYYKYISGIEKSTNIDFKIELYKSYVVEKKDNRYLINKS